MMDEPVQKRSAISTNAKRGEDHKINSSDKRLKCTITKLAAAANSIAKSRSDTASNEF